MADTLPIFTHGGIPNDIDDPQDIARKAGICVTMQRGKKIVKTMIDTPGECASLLNGARVAWVSFGVDDIFRDGIEVAKMLGFGDELTKRLLSDDQSHYYDFNAELGLRLPAVHTEGFDVHVVPIAIFMRRGLILTIHHRSSMRLLKLARYVDRFMRRFPEDLARRDHLTMLLTRIIDENTDRNFDYLRNIEERADMLSAQLVNEDIDRKDIGQKVYELKHALIVFLDTLWATLDVVHSLRYGDPEAISDRPEILGQITLVAEQINRQIQLSEHMSEVLVSGMEVMQSIYNNQLQELNNRMAHVTAWLTVLGTAVLVPNTLATVLGGSVFGLTTDDREWYAALLIISTVLSTLGAYIWVRQRAGLTARVSKK